MREREKKKMKKWKERRIICDRSKVRERITSENKETERKAKKNRVERV